jgi:rubrerythrin
MPPRRTGRAGIAVFDLKESLREAIRKEKEAYDLYRLVCAATTDVRRREFADRLAQDAIRHIRIIERTCKEHLPSLCTFSQHFVPEIELAAGAEADSPDEDALFEALESAIKHKCNLLEFYSALADASVPADADAQQEPHWNEMFRELLAAEEAHLRFVRAHLPSVP